MAVDQDLLVSNVSGEFCSKDEAVGSPIIPPPDELPGLHNAITRNNIFYCPGRAYPGDGGEPHNDFQNDLTGSLLGGGGLVRSMFLPSIKLEWYLAPSMNMVQVGRVLSITKKVVIDDDPVAQVPNPAIDKGVRLPGFNDDFTGTAPDIGAFENGRPPLRFGREMAPGFSRAPWELYGSVLQSSE